MTAIYEQSDLHNWLWVCWHRFLQWCHHRRVKNCVRLCIKSCCIRGPVLAWQVVCGLSSFGILVEILEQILGWYLPPHLRHRFESLLTWYFFSSQWNTLFFSLSGLVTTPHSPGSERWTAGADPGGVSIGKRAQNFRTTRSIAYETGNLVWQMCPFLFSLGSGRPFKMMTSKRMNYTRSRAALEVGWSLKLIRSYLRQCVTWWHFPHRITPYL